MSIAAQNWVQHVRGVPASKLAVLNVLAHCHNAKSGRCDPKVQTIADRAGKKVRQTRDDLLWLESAGLITRHPCFTSRVGSQTSTQYELHLSTPGAALPGPPAGERRGTRQSSAPRKNRKPEQEAGSDRYFVPTPAVTEEVAVIIGKIDGDDDEAPAPRRRRGQTDDDDVAAIGGLERPPVDKDPATSPVVKAAARRTAKARPHSAAALAAKWDARTAALYPWNWPTGRINFDRLRGAIQTWLRDGMDPAVIEVMIDIFCSDPRRHQRTGPPLWLAFVSSAAELEQLAKEATRYGRYKSHSDRRREADAPAVAPETETVSWAELLKEIQ